MRLSQLGVVAVGLAISGPCFVGCGGGGGTTGTGGSSATGGGGGVSAGGHQGGAGGSAGAVGGPGGGGATGAAGVTGSGGSATGSAGAAGALHDCFPACIANLRKACERPGLDGGTCGYGNGGYCYSNGVVEIQSVVDGGALVTFTEPDGHAPCYQVFTNLTGTDERYETPSGQVVAEVTTVDDVNYTVTCNGTTMTVDTSNPACAMLSEGACNSQNGCP